MGIPCIHLANGTDRWIAFAALLYGMSILIILFLLLLGEPEFVLQVLWKRKNSVFHRLEWMSFMPFNRQSTKENRKY